MSLPLSCLQIILLLGTKFATQAYCGVSQLGHYCMLDQVIVVGVCPVQLGCLLASLGPTYLCQWDNTTCLRVLWIIPCWAPLSPLFLLMVLPSSASHQPPNLGGCGQAAAPPTLVSKAQHSDISASVSGSNLQDFWLLFCFVLFTGDMESKCVLLSIKKLS